MPRSIFVSLSVKDLDRSTAFFAKFTQKDIVNAAQGTEVNIGLSADSRERLDANPTGRRADLAPASDPAPVRGRRDRPG